MRSGLIILIGFIVSAILMLAVWLISRIVLEKRRIRAEIEKQKTDIISTIEEAVNEGQKWTKPQQQTSVNGGMPVWGKWFMALSVVPLIVSFVLAGMQGQNAKLVPTKTIFTTAFEINENDSSQTDTTIENSLQSNGVSNPIVQTWGELIS
jgi:hypothetical protein